MQDRNVLFITLQIQSMHNQYDSSSCNVNTISHSVDCLYKILWIGLSMLGRNVSFITLSIQSMHNQYDSSSCNVNTISHSVDC